MVKLVMDDIAAEPSLRAVILTGEGKGFSAGGDLDWLAERAKVHCIQTAFVGCMAQIGSLLAR